MKKKIEQKDVAKNLLKAIVLITNVRKNNEEAIKYFVDINNEIDSFLKSVADEFEPEEKDEKDVAWKTEPEKEDGASATLTSENIKKAIEMMQRYKKKAPMTSFGAPIPLSMASESLKKKVMEKKAEKFEKAEAMLGVGGSAHIETSVYSPSPTLETDEVELPKEDTVAGVWCAVCEEYHDKGESHPF